MRHAAPYRQRVDSPAGFVALGILVVWLAYFVPGRLRDRAQLAQSRSEDRFSARLRVVAVAGGESVDGAPGQECSTPRSRAIPLLSAAKGAAARPSGMKGAHDMERSGISAARREQLVRRRASAKRRALLTAILGAVTLIMVVIAALSSLPMLSVLIPAAMLASVLLLGRRAVIMQTRADAEYARRERVAQRARESALRDAERAGVRRMGRPAPVVRPQVTARAMAASRATVAATASAGTVSSRMVGRVRVPVVQAADGVAASETVAAADVNPMVTASTQWESTRVPRPLYATKAAAPRWEPAPLSAEIERVSRKLAQWDAEQSVTADSEQGSESEQGSVYGNAAMSVGANVPLNDRDVAAAAEQGTESLGGIALDGILERRRAVGE